MPAIVCTDVRRTFADVIALDNICLTVEKHQIFGLLGPNGSGKTTLLNQIQGLDTPDSGHVEVLGYDPADSHAQLVQHLRSQHQEAALPPRLTVRETLDLFAAFYSHRLNSAQLISDLLLDDKADARVEKLSGGQRQRVLIALALIHQPELLLFDELTSALDPHTKHSIWNTLRTLREAGKTIVLTTHSMEEAAQICDRIAIMDKGHILAEGSPNELINRYAPHQTLTLSTHIPLNEGTLATLHRYGATPHAGQSDSQTTWEVTGEEDVVAQVARDLVNEGISVTDMTFKQPTLEDVFLLLTHATEKEDGR